MYNLTLFVRKFLNTFTYFFTYFYFINIFHTFLPLLHLERSKRRELLPFIFIVKCLKKTLTDNNTAQNTVNYCAFRITA